MSEVSTKEQSINAGAESPAGAAPSADPTPTPEAETLLLLRQLEELKTKAEKAEENWDRLVRVSADFDNYKKRAIREKADAIKFGVDSLLGRLVPILDNCEIALAATQNPQATMQSVKEGVTMILSQLRGVLNESGLEEVDALNQPFDPNLHEAVSETVTADAPEGTVVQQLRKGYKLHDRLLRPATVSVAKKPSA